MAKIYGISFKQVTNWVNRFEESGVIGLYDLSGRGRKSILSESDLENIRSVVLKELPTKYGYDRKRWSGPILLEWIDSTYNTRYQSAQVYKLLNRIGVEFRKEEGYVAKDNV